MLKISALDQSPIREGHTAAEALAESVRLAQAVERFGYHRYWVAEHHGTEGFAGSSPEIMVARIAAATDRIRVGSGGVMLTHYSPLKVAENFRLLENLYPGRIDLGIGRAPGSSPQTALALGYGSTVGIEYFPTKIADLSAFLTDQPPQTSALKGVRATPHAPSTPEIWLLGSSAQSAAYAAQFGLAYSYAHFINPTDGPEIVDAYRRAFKPSLFLAEPLATVAVFVICADTREEAELEAKCRDLWRIRLEHGGTRPYPSIEKALAYEYTDHDRAIIARSRERVFIGTAATVKAEIEALAEQYDAAEAMILTICYEQQARLHSYELLGEAFDLTRRDS